MESLSVRQVNRSKSGFVFKKRLFNSIETHFRRSLVISIAGSRQEFIVLTAELVFINHKIPSFGVTRTVFKGIVSRDWGGLLMGSVDRYLVLDVPATYLFIILMSSSYVKF
jgi:hypothetical protein